MFTIDYMGRKTIQIMGFTMLTIMFIILGFAYHAILNTSVPLFIVLYTITQIFFNWGPNTTTFIVRKYSMLMHSLYNDDVVNDDLFIAGECFPTRYRSTAHGISAASGKVGSIIAQVGFGLLKDIGGKNNWIDHLLEVFALFMLTGIFSSLFIPETKGKTLEELGDEEHHHVERSSDGKAIE